MQLHIDECITEWINVCMVEWMKREGERKGGREEGMSCSVRERERLLLQLQAFSGAICSARAAAAAAGGRWGGGWS